MKLSKDIEDKKTEVQKREAHVFNMQKSLDIKRLELEELKEDFEKNKINYIHKYLKIQPMEATNVVENEEQAQSLELQEIKKGKVDILHDLLRELVQQGGFKATFLIDGKGMIISEHSNREMDALAIGAMFSLICTTVLRAVKNLTLNKLEYFKLSSIDGKFLLKSIDITGYDRNFILLGFYDDSVYSRPNKNQKLDRKLIKNMLKDFKKEFEDYNKNYEDITSLSIIFDNISERIKYLKQKYCRFEGNIDILRIESLNVASLKISRLFEA